MHSYLLATHYDPTWYKAWHTWALTNFEVIGFMDNQAENKTIDIPGNNLAAHTVQAVQGTLLPISRYRVLDDLILFRLLPFYCASQ